jgi:hypothetical protein
MLTMLTGQFTLGQSNSFTLSGKIKGLDASKIFIITFDDAFNDYKSTNRIVCNVDTLDNFIKSNSITRIDFVKIDVEGHELQVLMGAKESIGQFRPIMFVEIARTISDRDYFNWNFEKVFDFAREMNYVPLRSNGKSMIFPRWKNSKIHHVHMYLLVPAEIAFLVSAKLLIFITSFHISSVLNRIWILFRRLILKFSHFYQILKTNILIIANKLNTNGRLCRL